MPRLTKEDWERLQQPLPPPGPRVREYGFRDMTDVATERNKRTDPVWLAHRKQQRDKAKAPKT